MDFTPSLLSAAGIPVPATMQGHSFLPLLDRQTQGWRNEVYLEMSEFITGRGLRTPQFTYAAFAPKVPGWRAVPTVEQYVEYMLYDLYSDPYQMVNLAGRVPYQKTSADLRQRLLARMREASGENAALVPVLVGLARHIHAAAGAAFRRPSCSVPACRPIGTLWLFRRVQATPIRLPSITWSV